MDPDLESEHDEPLRRDASNALRSRGYGLANCSVKFLLAWSRSLVSSLRFTSNKWLKRLF